MGGARGAVLGLELVGVFHGHIAIAVVVLWAPGERAARRRQCHRVGPRGRGRGCVRILLDLWLQTGISLGVLWRGHVMRSVPRLAGCRVGFGVGGPLLLHDAGDVCAESSRRSAGVGGTADSAGGQSMQAEHPELRGRER